MDPTIVVAGIGMVGGALSAVLSYRANAKASSATSEATKVSARQVEAEAYTRSREFYEKLLGETDAHADRLRNQVQELENELMKVTQQLAEERRQSEQLRTQVRQLHERLLELEADLRILHARLEEARANPGT